MNYAIDDGHGNRLTAGLQGEDHARAIAQRMANERGQTVYVYKTGDQEESGEALAVEPASA